MNEFVPGYVRLSQTGELEQRAIAAQSHLAICDICALNCPVDRLSGKLGACRIGKLAKVSSFSPHYGEEGPLSGWHGSGTIFFTRCNLRCQFCQNHEISQTDQGDEVTSDQLARIMLRLQEYGCHNINFVSPSHIVPQILSSLPIAVKMGLRLPLVYNSGGYDSLAMLALLDGVIDIYMPDMKYGDKTTARTYSRIPDYPQKNQAAVREMHRQVGDLQVNEDGLAIRGLIVRHLVLPNNLSGTEMIVRFLASEISKDTYLNIMDQYRPEYHAHQCPEINRPITSDEYQSSVRMAQEAGLYRLA